MAHKVYQPDFQWNKFPPNVAFLLLGVGHFGLLTLAAPAIRGFARSRTRSALTAPYRSYGYTIYLFHPLAFSVVMWSFGHGRTGSPGPGHPATTLASIFAGMVVLVPVLAWPF